LRSDTALRHGYRGLPDIEYPVHDRTATVTTCRAHLFQSAENQSRRGTRRVGRDRRL